MNLSQQKSDIWYSQVKSMALALCVCFAHAAQAQITTRDGASNFAAVSAVRDQFRVDLGGGTTVGANGSFGGLRREVNWDGESGAVRPIKRQVFRPFFTTYTA